MPPRRRPGGAPARSSGRCRRRRRRRRGSPRRHPPAGRSPRSSPTRWRTRSRAAALEVGDRPLQPLAGRVLAARVLVAGARPPDAVLRVGRGLVDRRRHGARRLVGLGARVDRPRREGVARPRAGRICVVHGPIIASTSREIRYATHRRSGIARCRHGRLRAIVRSCPEPTGTRRRSERCVTPPLPPSASTSPAIAPERDRRAADAWRRVHAQADAERDRIHVREPGARPIPVAGSRAAVAGWLAGLMVRASKPAG